MSALRRGLLVAALLGCVVAVGAASARSSSGPLDGALAIVSYLDQASAASRAGDPAAMQLRYDTARDLEETTRAARISAQCQPLEQALFALARAHVAAAEAFDRLLSRATFEARAVQARKQVERLRRTCRPGGRPVTAATTRSLTSPEPGAAFFGEVKGTAPPGTKRVQITLNGRSAVVVPASGTTFKATVNGPTGQTNVEALFIGSGGKQIDAAVSRGAWLLPAASTLHASATHADDLLSSRLAFAATHFPGYAAVYVERLATGDVGTWNADSRFPAASTVKLGVMVEAARRFGYAPTSRITYDLEQIGRWSSNLAANRLLRMIGIGDSTVGVRAVEARLGSMGAPSSTYPGEYRAGTLSGGPPTQPPLSTSRVTTARDLASILKTIVGAAAGRAVGRAHTGLGVEGARSILRMLLQSQLVADNVGLLRPSVPKGLPVAQKNGWVRDTRSTAAVLFQRAGPTVVVVLANRPQGVSLSSAQTLGREVVSIVGR